jgi:hypothetical protein
VTDFVALLGDKGGFDLEGVECSGGVRLRDDKVNLGEVVEEELLKERN